MVLIRKINLFILLLTVSFCINARDPVGLEAVSIMDLRLNPEQYENNNVHVVGYLSELPTALYITKEYEQLSIGGDSIKVIDSSLNGDFINSDCMGKYVAIIAEFKKSDSKRNNSTYYFLTNIDNVKYIENDRLNFCYRK